jgi:retrotransposon gag protein
MTTRRNPAAAAAANPEDGDRLEQLQEENKRLQEALRIATTATAPRATGPKVRKPTPFDGTNASQLPEFLAQVHVAFKARPFEHPTEEDKVWYAVSFLEGPALSFFEPYMHMDELPAEMDSYPLFVDQLRKAFGDPDLRGKVSHQLRQLRQTGSAAVYAAEFRRLARQLNWENENLVGQFFDGLKDEVQLELARTDYPEELGPLILHAVRVDNLQQRLRSRRALTKTTLPITSPGQRLTEPQKEYRRKNNLCLYCGDAGHMIRTCPARPKGPSTSARLSEAVLVTSESQGNGSAQLL